MIRAVWMAALLALGCSSPSTPARESARPESTADTTGLPLAIPTTMAELEAMTTAIRSGTWTPESAQVSRLGCLESEGHEPTCVDARNLLFGPPWLDPPAAGAAWVAILAEPPGMVAVAPRRDALLQIVTCSLLDRLWQTVPQQHLDCTTNEDCVILTDTCFAAPMARASAEPYRQLIRRVGAMCLDPAGGVCPPSTDEARCAEHRCVAIETL